MTLISARGSAHDFSVKFSPSVCVACSSFLDRRLNLWLYEVLLTMLMEQQTVTNPKVCVL